jgi:hypothetical protein
VSNEDKPRNRIKRAAAVDASSPHPLAQAAAEYSNLFMEWFKTSESELREKEQEILARAKLDPQGVKEEVTRITGIVHTLRASKQQMQTALKSALELAGPGPTQSPEAQAAVSTALASMQRAIDSWLQMKECFPEQTDNILNLLLHLDRLRRKVQAEFQPPAAAPEETGAGPS